MSYSVFNMSYVSTGNLCSSIIYLILTLSLLHIIIVTVEAQAAGGGDVEQQFLSLHNQARQQAGLPALTWDASLAAYAESYAAKVQCQMVHSGGPYGENLFWGSSGKQWTPADALNSWMSEAQNFHYESNSCDPGAMCGHYTQVMWRDTTAVGCDLHVCATSTLVVCEYNPRGNYVGKRPF